MRALVMSISALAFTLLAACGDHTVEEACENMCSCGPSGLATLCEAACVDRYDGADISQACIDCSAEATCSELNDDKCASKCD